MLVHGDAGLRHVLFQKKLRAGKVTVNGNAAPQRARTGSMGRTSPHLCADSNAKDLRPLKV